MSSRITPSEGKNKDDREQGRVLRDPRMEGSSYVPEFGNSRRGNAPKTTLSGSWNRFNNNESSSFYKKSATPYYNLESKQKEDNEYIPRPRSPIQRILRFHLNDPQLTSVEDVRFRPYDNNNDFDFSKNKQSEPERPKPEHQTQPKRKINNMFKQPGYLQPRGGSRKRMERRNASKLQAMLEKNPLMFKPRNNFYIKDAFIVDESRSMFAGIVPFKELEFEERCKRLGITHKWYKTKMTDIKGQNLEQIVIEIRHKNIPYRINGGFTEVSEAKEAAFTEALRRLDFLFGKNDEKEGFLSNPNKFLGIDHENETMERQGVEIPQMIPNPLHRLIQPPPPPPPPPPKFAPPRNPPLPTDPPPVNLTWTLEYQPPPQPPGTDNFYDSSYKTNSFETDYDSNLQSSWLSMCNKSGFYNTNSVNPGNQKDLEAIIPSEMCSRGYFTTNEKSQEKKIFPTGPNETSFNKKISLIGLIYSCNELPVDIREGQEYFCFKVEFWDKKTPNFREKTWGTFMLIPKDARESAFGVALGKLLKIYPDEKGSFEDLDESFNPESSFLTYSSWMSSKKDNRIQDSGNCINSFASPGSCPSKPIEKGRGRGLLLKDDEGGQSIMDHRDWRWPGH